MSAQRTWSGGAASIEPVEVGRDRRRAQRIDTVIRATIRPEGRLTAPIKVRLVDICDHGARLLMRRKLEVGERLILDLECELPLRVHLGYDAHSLVVDGPMHTHLVELEVVVVRRARMGHRLWDVGIEMSDGSSFDAKQCVQSFVDHLREVDSWENRP